MAFKTTFSAIGLACMLIGGSDDIAGAETPASFHLTASQLFGLADAARDHADYATAEKAYRALATNPDVDLRSEARFRLAMMLADREHRYRDAAIELRHVLDEKPKAARVRLELARIDGLLGRINEAGRELRAAQAVGLPPTVEQTVRFYAQALDTHRRLGGSVEAVLAPDSNVNRATASGTLGTAIGDFTLSRNAMARSGLGLAVRGQGFARAEVSGHTSLLARLSGSANIYRQSRFDDYILAPQAGPEFIWSHDKISLSAGPAWRWYGTKPYTSAIAASLDWQHVIGRRAQLRTNTTIAHISNLFDPQESGESVSLTAGVDRAFTARFGGGLMISGSRQNAKDPGYATAGMGVSGYLFRELGQTTVAANLSYSHVEADRRLLLFTHRRVDNDVSAAISGTFRQLQIGAISPLIRLRYERNVSRVQLYDYRRFAGELGLATAF